MRDFLLIMQEHKYFDDDRWNKTDYTYTFETGSKIEFFSSDQSSKVRGPRRDRLFMNEANNMPFETFEQLEVRTKEFVFLDCVPHEAKLVRYGLDYGYSNDPSAGVAVYRYNGGLIFDEALYQKGFEQADRRHVLEPSASSCHR
jgi:hypothetical protein